MSNWLLARFGVGAYESRVPRLVRAFTPADPTLSRDGIQVDDKGWMIDSQGDQVVRLFEVPDPGVENCVLTYRAAMKCEDLEGRAYLEMWCRLPGRGEFFSRGIHQAIKRSTDWSSYEVLFRLKKGQRPDLVKLNVVIEGRGKVWVRSVELIDVAR
jgi:hypothetical protein